MTKEAERDGRATKNIGLRGVVVADSTISKVDGEKGLLIYRGYDIAPLAEKGTFEEVVYLLLGNRLPEPKELARLQEELAAERILPPGVIETLNSFPRESVPMDVLQAMIPVLAMHDPEPEEVTGDHCRRQALRLVARLPLIMSAWERIRRGREIVPAKRDLGHGANLLYTLHGEEPDPATAKVMDAILTLHADHGFNASTFTARQIASSRAHLYAAVSGAVGSLSGALHGGANERVYRMLQEIGSVGKVRDYVVSTLDGKGLIMGMGHAVYQTTDPRAAILGPMAEGLAAREGHPELFEIAEEVRKVTGEEFRKRKGREIYANVDFYSAIVNSMIGVPVDMFTPLFALGRIAGWSAHYLEERFGGAGAKPTLYRPKAEYTGRYCGLEGCDWLSREER